MWHVANSNKDVILFAKLKKSQALKIHRFLINFGPRFGIILEAFSNIFPYFFNIEFCIDFHMDFLWKMGPKCVPKSSVGTPRKSPKNASLAQP